MAALHFRMGLTVAMLCRKTGFIGKIWHNRANSGMTRSYVFCAIIALGVSGCGAVSTPRSQVLSDLGAQVVRGERPTGPTDTCWASDTTPAIIETVTVQIAEDATADRDAGYRIETQQNIVKPREDIWFRTPCPNALTPEVISTLQRALAARGLFSGEPSGNINQVTRTAIRGYQRPRGLNSDRLSLAAAQELGVVASDFGQPTN